MNVYGERLVFGHEPPVLLRSVSGLSRPDGQIVRTQGAYQDGETFSRMRLPARSVQVQFDIPPCESREALYRERMRIERVLTSGRCMRNGKTGLLIYENDAGMWQTGAVPEGTVAYGRRFQNAMAEGRVNFLCPDASLQESAVHSAQLRMGRGGFSLPARLPVRLGARNFRAELVNGGTAETPVEIVIEGTGETPCILNHTTGAEIVVAQVIANGERLIISTDPKALSCLLEHADGSVEDAFGYLDPSVAVSAFLLTPGNNDVEYVPSVASAGSRVGITWHNAFEGV